MTDTTGCFNDLYSKQRGTAIATYNGSRFFVNDPTPEEIDINVIAHALSNLCRFGGHCSQFYSVAEHSIRVASILPPELQLTGLLHDASEAYLVDMPRPIKIIMPQYLEIEGKIMESVATKFNLFWPMPDHVKWADNALLAAEKKWLMPNSGDWGQLPDGYPYEINPLPPDFAEEMFKVAYADIIGHGKIQFKMEEI